MSLNYLTYYIILYSSKLEEMSKEKVLNFVAVGPVNFIIWIWWLIYAMSYKRVFGAKTRKVATRQPAKR